MPEPMPSATIGRTRRPPYEPPHPRRRSRFLLVGLPMIAVFAAFASVVWLAYVDGAPGSAMGEPPLIKADASPLKLSPDDPGGRVVADQGEVRELFRDEPAPQPELLLPRPEQPITSLAEAEPDAAEPPALAGTSSDDGPDLADGGAVATAESSSAAGATAAEQTQPAPQQLATVPPGDTQAAAGGVQGDAGAAAQADGATEDDPEAALDALLAEVTGGRTETSSPGATQPAEAAPGQPAGQPAASAERQEPAQPAPRPAETDVRPAISAPVPQPGEPAEPRPARAEREQTQIAEIEPGEPVPARQETAPNVIRPAPQQPAQQDARPTREPVQVEPAPTQVAAVDPSYRIQLAAVREESDARRAWDLFQLDLGDVLVGVDPIIERAETANGVFYRVQVGPFANLASAESLCDRLKQRNASCFVIRR